MKVIALVMALFNFSLDLEVKKACMYLVLDVANRSELLPSFTTPWITIQ